MAHSRTDVVAAALRVLDAHGLEGCSMRRVAAALDVQPSALYHHVPDKQTLLALMADEIVRSVTAPDGGGAHLGDAPRRDASEPAQDAQTAASLCRELRRAMLAVRDGADVVATASAYRLGASAVEARLAELLASELGERTEDLIKHMERLSAPHGDAAGELSHDTETLSVAASEGARTLLHFVFGHTQATQMQVQALEFQALAAGRPADAAADPPGESRAALDASFDRGVATILAGLRVQLTVPAGASASAVATAPAPSM